MGWVFSDEMRFYLHDGETLLAGMQRTHHQHVKFECRQGYCGACKMRVKACTGTIRTIQTPIAILEEDEILACCCQITGSICVTYAAKQDDDGAGVFDAFITQNT